MDLHVENAFQISRRSWIEIAGSFNPASKNSAANPERQCGGKLSVIEVVVVVLALTCKWRL